MPRAEVRGDDPDEREGLRTRGEGRKAGGGGRVQNRGGQKGGFLGKIRRHLGKIREHLGKISGHLGRTEGHLELRASGQKRGHMGKIGQHLGDTKGHLGKHICWWALYKGSVGHCGCGKGWRGGEGSLVMLVQEVVRYGPLRQSRSAYSCSQRS